jgi:hypothetical protein
MGQDGKTQQSLIIDFQAPSSYILLMRTTLRMALMLILVGSCSHAGVVLDQQQLSGPTYMAAFSQTDLAQSFQQAYSNVAGAGIQLQSGVGTTGDITIALYDNLPNAGGTLLANGTALGASAGSWADVFWTPVSVVPNTTYYLVFTTNQAMGIAGDTTNPYSRGQVYANPGYEAFPQYDYAFRTYADDASVPEPSSFLLLAAGIAGLIALKRRHAN